MNVTTESFAPDPSPARLPLLDRARYKAQQGGLAALLNQYFRIGARLILGGPPSPPPPAALSALMKRFDELLDRDIENVELGYYPRDLLFQIPFKHYLKRLPETFADAPRVVRRIKSSKTDELPEGVDLEHYPAYYRRNFHWQTDGWLSERSARMYDVNVEILFGGTADVMRRMAIPPLVDALRGRTRPRVLDVACGTGRFLKQLHQALPSAKLYGLDMSPYYLSHARRVLRRVPDVSLVAENAEAMPFGEATFDAVSSVFLFHELPKDARRNVAREMFRVLKPGGRLVVNDSAQLIESPEIATFLGSFQQMFHEPYFKGYIQDDLAPMLESVGFNVRSSRAHFVSKVVVAEKPELPPPTSVGAHEAMAPSSLKKRS